VTQFVQTVLDGYRDIIDDGDGQQIARLGSPQMT